VAEPITRDVYQITPQPSFAHARHQITSQLTHMHARADLMNHRSNITRARAIRAAPPIPTISLAIVGYVAKVILARSGTMPPEGSILRFWAPCGQSGPSAHPDNLRAKVLMKGDIKSFSKIVDFDLKLTVKGVYLVSGGKYWCRMSVRMVPRLSNKNRASRYLTR